MKKKLLILLVLVVTIGLGFSQDSRYDAGLNLPFNEKLGDVNPQTGNITLSATDVSLPGRAGFNFTFGRTWSLNQSNVFNMYYDNGLNLLDSNTVEKYSKMGVGWNTSIPYINKDQKNNTLSLFFGGNVYELKTESLGVKDLSKSNIRGYELTDLRVYDDTGVSYGDSKIDISSIGNSVTDTNSKTSKYVLLMKDNQKYYFRDDGKLMVEIDKSGLNKIWYFYDIDSKLRVVVDTVGRKIIFNYDTNNNLSSIQWDVELWVKEATGITKKTVTKKVEYQYEDLDTYPLIAGMNSNKVLNYIKPYCLKSVRVKIKEGEYNVTRYNYIEGETDFTYDKDKSVSTNIYLMINEIIDNNTDDGKFKSKRVLEYGIEEKKVYTKYFYGGYMQNYRLTKEYYVNKNNREMNETKYIYYEKGENQNFNQYSTEILSGKVKRTYYYNLDNTNMDHVLSKIVTESEDGFLELKEFTYNYDKTKSSDEIHREGEWVYSERYNFDNKGNLKRFEDRRGLVTVTDYDDVFSIPISVKSTLEVDGVEKEYKTEKEINSLGQITREKLYLENGKKWINVSTYEYDSYGNVVKKIDANNNVLNIKYDVVTNSLPIKAYQDVSIDVWNNTIGTFWINNPDKKQLVGLATWKVFNTDGSIWLEIDNRGYSVEHYYDLLGTEIESVMPDKDVDEIIDVIGLSGSVDDFYKYMVESGKLTTFLNKRKDNPSVRNQIDYQNDFVKVSADIDKAKGQVKITGKEGDGLGHVLREIEYKGAEEYSTKLMQYDKYGRMVVLTDADREEKISDIQIADELFTDIYDRSWIIGYDDLGRKRKVLYPKTNGNTDIKLISYDDVRNIVTTVDPIGRTIIEEYDWAGNLVKVTRKGDGNTSEDNVEVITFQYDKLGRKISFCDGKGIVTKYRYDERNLLIEQIFGEETGSDVIEYNDLGQMVKKTDRNGNIIRSYYDQLGRNTKIDQYKAGVSGVMESIELSYDNRGNVTRVSNSNLIEHYIYDYGNRVVKLERRLKDGSIRTTLANTVWKSATADNQIFSFDYVYNDGGLVTGMKYPDGSIHNFSYDGELGRVTKIQDGTNDFVSDFTYTIGGVVTKMSYANNTYQEWEFDNRKRISHIKIANKTETIDDLKYSLNGSGDILSINNNEYGYDGFDRIVYAKTQILGSVDKNRLILDSFGTYKGGDPVEGRIYDVSADLNNDNRINGADHSLASFEDMSSLYDIESFVYDKNGNRTKLTQNGDEYYYSYGVQNRLIKVEKQAKGSTIKRVFAEYVYDNNGNTLKRTITKDDGKKDVIDFTYDALNRLIKTVENGKLTEYYYDNGGNRFIKKTDKELTVYLRHGQIAVAMDLEVKLDSTNDVGSISRYVLSGELLAGRITTVIKKDWSKETKKSWYHLDHLNSTKAVTDSAGKMEALYEYRAFGEELKKLGSGDAKYTYGGKELDEDTNLYYFNARYYDATTGRFINVDPIQSGLNWYIYANNNPLNRVDPTGLKDKNIIKEKIIDAKDYVVDKAVKEWNRFKDAVADEKRFTNEYYAKESQAEEFANKAARQSKEYPTWLGYIIFKGSNCGPEYNNNKFGDENATLDKNIYVNTVDAYANTHDKMGIEANGNSAKIRQSDYWLTWQFAKSILGPIKAYDVKTNQMRDIPLRSQIDWRIYSFTGMVTFYGKAFISGVSDGVQNTYNNINITINKASMDAASGLQEMENKFYDSFRYPF